MRLSLFALSITAGLVSCTDFDVPETKPTPVAAEKSTITRSTSQGEAALRRVQRKVEPVAERMCREERKPARSIECDFLIIVDRSAAKVPNAYQTLDKKSGRPIIAFNVPMLRTIKNDDEIAFILGHEAGHQIGAHIAKTRTTATAGAILLGTIIQAAGGNAAAVKDAQKIGGSFAARAYSKEFELEADVLGAYVSEAAGYDPVRGARSFARFGGGSNSFLSTHPASGNRIATVNAAAEQIKRQRAQGLTPRPPRR